MSPATQMCAACTDDVHSVQGMRTSPTSSWWCRRGGRGRRALLRSLWDSALHFCWDASSGPSRLRCRVFVATHTECRGGEFKFEFHVSADYPHKPPKVLCKTKVYHPNIDLEGNVCLNVLREEWKPVLNINTIIYGLNHLFVVRSFHSRQLAWRC